jgi:hypothetical protein
MSIFTTTAQISTKNYPVFHTSNFTKQLVLMAFSCTARVRNARQKQAKTRNQKQAF